MRQKVPNKWVVLTIAKGDVTQIKIFSGNSEEYGLSSVIVQTDWNEEAFFFITASGTRYVCNKYCYGMSLYMHNVLEKWKTPEGDISIEITKGYGTV